MPEVLNLTWADVEARAYDIADRMYRGFTLPARASAPHIVKAYPIPNGGIHAAQALKLAAAKWDIRIGLMLVEKPEDADIYIDDLVDSGATFERTLKEHGTKPFFALMNKKVEKEIRWISFPWERMERKDGPHDNIRRILEYIGEDPDREGLLETPKRVVKSYSELYSGYQQNPASIMTTFEDVKCDEMVLLKGVEFISNCEHHMLPFVGKAHIAYIPNGRVLGISKLARLLEIYSRRLQIQERLCEQVTAALVEHLKPLGAACVIEARHMCMCSRGVQKQNSVMVTSSLTGVFREPAVRSEFFNLVKG